MFFVFFYVYYVFLFKHAGNTVRSTHLHNTSSTPAEYLYNNTETAHIRLRFYSAASGGIRWFVHKRTHTHTPRKIARNKIVQCLCSKLSKINLIWKSKYDGDIISNSFVRFFILWVLSNKINKINITLKCYVIQSRCYSTLFFGYCQIK